MNNSNERIFEVSFTRSASRDARDLMCNDVETFDFFIQRIAKRKKLDVKNWSELLIAYDLLKMEITYN
jgi:hypothetical protein